MPGAETVKLQVELVEKNAEARLKALDKLATEMGNRKITLNFDEASLTRWKTATDGMTNAQINAFAKMAVAAENTAQEEIAAANRVQQEVIKAEAKKVVETEKANAKIAAESEKANAKIIAATEKTAQAAINAESKREQAALKSNSRITESTSMFGKMSDKVFKAYSSGAITAEQATLLMEQGQRSLAVQLGITALKAMALHRAFSLIVTAMRSAVSEMKDMDKALTTIQMVTGMSTSQISGVRQTALKSAKETGRTTSDYLSAAERFARAGYRENIEALTKLSLVTQNVGGVTEDVASKFILAADAAWKMGGSTERLWAMLDGVTAIADQNATDIGKIAEAYTVAGSAFANAGESERTFAALIGTTTAATQRSGSEMARGLQTILFRVRQVKGELDDGEIINAEDISNAAEALDSVGISVLNDANELKSFSEIMGELNEKWDTLNTKQKAYLQNALAGNRRGNVLFSLMDNWDVFEKQLSQFDEASGTALQKNEVYLDSWEAKIDNLKTTWVDFVSDTLSADSFKGLIDGLTKVLNTIGNLQNAIQIFITLLVALKGATINLAFEKMASSMAVAIASSAGLKAALAGIGKAILSPAGVLTAIGAAISILSILSTKEKQAADDAIRLGKSVLSSAADIIEADKHEQEVAMRKATEAKNAAEKRFRQEMNKAMGGGNQIRDAIRIATNDASFDFDVANGAEDMAWYEKTYRKIEDAARVAKKGTEEYKTLSGFLNKVDESYDNFIELRNGYDDLDKAIKGDEEAIRKLRGDTNGQDTFSKSNEEAAKAALESAKVYAYEAEAVDQLSTAFKNASENIQKAAENMKAEKDDSIKSAADIYKAMKEAADKGYYGSNAYKEGAKLFFGTSDKSAIGKIAQDALDTYFDAIAKGDYSNAAATLWGNFADDSGKIIDKTTGKVIASMTDLGDAYRWAFNKGEQSIDDFLSSMQSSTGIGKDFWASMIQSLGMYSEEMDQWMEDNKELPEAELHVKTDSAEEEVQSAVDRINKMLDSIHDKTVRINVIESINGMSVSTAEYYASNATKSYAWSGYGSSRTRKAGGKHDNYSGIALVNDEFPADGSKPELIISKSQGRAYIANGGKPALVNLRSDDVVLTAKETESAMGGIPTFEDGKEDTGGALLGGLLKVIAESFGVTTPKDGSEDNKKNNSGKKKPDADKTWAELKKLIEYLLDKAEGDLKDQLKVLDDMLEEMENSRKAEQEAKKLEELQTAAQEALVDLQRAQTERTVRYYNEETQQWEWMADQGSVEKAQEAYNNALDKLKEYEDDLAYEAKKAEIEAQKDALQEQYNLMKDGWDDIVDAIEAPSGDIEKLLNTLIQYGTPTMQEQSGGIADLLNKLRDGLFGAGYELGLGNINANTKNSGTTSSTVFDDGGFAYGSGMMRKGSGTETVIGPGITRAILNPVKNERFSSFVDSLRYLVDGGNGSFSFGNRSSITNNNGGNYYVNGVRVGSDMAQRPFAEVMKTIAIHANESL